MVSGVTASELSRLLGLYPINVLRSTWSLGQLTKEKAIAKVVEEQTESAILTFAFENFPYTRQHVYLFELSRAVNTFPANPLGWDTAPTRRSSGAGMRSYFYLLDLKF
jgi:hypothetical protein